MLPNKDDKPLAEGFLQKCSQMGEKTRKLRNRNDSSNIILLWSGKWLSAIQTVSAQVGYWVVGGGGGGLAAA